MHFALYISGMKGLSSIFKQTTFGTKDRFDQYICISQPRSITFIVIYLLHFCLLLGLMAKTSTAIAIH